jgi:hypothetical protein
MKRSITQRARDLRESFSLSELARAERRRDRAGLPAEDPGTERVLPALMAWMGLAQDRSASADGGVARSFDLLYGWETSYPETTGYIVPTFIEYGRRAGDAASLDRARRMADWLVAIQLPGGGFQGGRIDSSPVVPVTFNTGQILLGLAAAEAAFGGYGDAMRGAADWLVQTQDADGCWRRHPTPFAAVGEKEYETHVAWGLFEAARIDAGRGYGEAGVRNVHWALSSQHADGWLPKCCLDDPARPLTHTIGYALRGVLEACRYRPDAELLARARRIADGLLGAVRGDGALPGRWMMLARMTGERGYADAAFRANAYVRRTVRLDGPPEMRGGVKGSFPVDGAYGRFQYLNWAAKFLADSLMLEDELRREAQAAARSSPVAAAT